MKSEPEEFSIADLARVGVEPWTGIRNYQARNFLRDEMRPGDRVLFYHSACAVPGVVGLAEIAGTAYPDPTQFDRRSPYHDPSSDPAAPRWLAIDVRFVRAFAKPVTLQALKHESALAEMLVLRRGNRLSVTPVEPAHYAHILRLETSR